MVLAFSTLQFVFIDWLQDSVFSHSCPNVPAISFHVCYFLISDVPISSLISDVSDLLLCVLQPL
jgi:hypothetical protein